MLVLFLFHSHTPELEYWEFWDWEWVLTRFSAFDRAWDCQEWNDIDPYPYKIKGKEIRRFFSDLRLQKRRDRSKEPGCSSKSGFILGETQVWSANQNDSLHWIHNGSLYWIIFLGVGGVDVLMTMSCSKCTSGVAVIHGTYACDRQSATELAAAESGKG